MSLKLQPIFHLGSPRKTDPTKCQVSFGKLKKKLFFGGTWWGPFSRAKQSGKLPERRRLQKIGHFQGHRWRNSHSFAKSGCKCSHRWRNSLISPDIHQPTSPKYATSIRVIPRQKAKPPGKTSELSQDRKQNHQERHQSCPFWDIDGATASCLGITLIDVAYFGWVG